MSGIHFHLESGANEHGELGANMGEHGEYGIRTYPATML